MNIGETIFVEKFEIDGEFEQYLWASGTLHVSSSQNDHAPRKTGRNGKCEKRLLIAAFRGTDRGSTPALIARTGLSSVAPRRMPPSPPKTCKVE
jgi:hypothetical protein